MEMQDQVKIILWAIGIANSVMLFTLGLYGKWIWDLNKKVASAVIGSECEVRNESQYDNTKALRLEVKEDMKELKRTLLASVKDMAASNQSCVETIARVVEKLTSKD